MKSAKVQALECTPPGLPLGFGHIRTQSHDYVRHGTVTLFTALDYLQGCLISSIEYQRRPQEWLDFLKMIDRETPKHLQLHLIVNNYATHKPPKAWLEKHKRFHMHFTPTSSSEMNMVERFFRTSRYICARAVSVRYASWKPRLPPFWRFEMLSRHGMSGMPRAKIF